LLGKYKHEPEPESEPKIGPPYKDESSGCGSGIRRQKSLRKSKRKVLKKSRTIKRK
jgi:hypothetical protein